MISVDSELELECPFKHGHFYHKVAATMSTSSMPSISPTSQCVSSLVNSLVTAKLRSLNQTNSLAAPVANVAVAEMN